MVQLRLRGLIAAFLVAGSVPLLSCVPTADTDPTAFKGAWLPKPMARPDFTLLNTDREAYSFFESTKGSLTFLFFGYTHCPDVCPVHMANLSSAIAKLDYADRQKIKVVFVTADPARDTPEVLGPWLSGFDRTFVGLYGTVEEIDKIHESLSLGKPVRDKPGPKGQYAVAHAGQIIVFQPNDTSYVVYPFGTRQQDWAADLPRLINESFFSTRLSTK